MTGAAYIVAYALFDVGHGGGGPLRLRCVASGSTAAWRPRREVMAKARRTTHRSSKGTKLYAMRDSKGRFTDIQTYKRAHSADLRRKSKVEESATR